MPTICPKHKNGSPGGMAVRHSRFSGADRSTAPACSCSALQAIEESEKMSMAIRIGRGLELVYDSQAALFAVDEIMHT